MHIPRNGGIWMIDLFMKRNLAETQTHQPSLLPRAKVVVIYNFDIKTQKIDLLHRGEDIPQQYREYQRLWRVRDKERNIETIIISI
jgi:type II secretory pathway component PulL